MGQLHEVLAVENDLKSAKESIKTEVSKILSTPQFFISAVRSLKMLDENRKGEEGIERQNMAFVLSDILGKIEKGYVPFIDAKLQKEIANQQAKADIIIEGKTLAKDIPVCFLLNMEEEIKQLRKVYEGVPILPDEIIWEKDEVKGKDIYRSKYPVEKNKTEKRPHYEVVVQPTKEHPAQVKEWTEDKPVGKYITDTWSSAMTRVEKTALLSRIDNLLKAIKKARQRANNQEIQKREIGKIFFDYIRA